MSPALARARALYGVAEDGEEPEEVPAAPDPRELADTGAALLTEFLEERQPASLVLALRCLEDALLVEGGVPAEAVVPALSLALQLQGPGRDTADHLAALAAALDATWPCGGCLAEVVREVLSGAYAGATHDRTRAAEACDRLRQLHAVSPAPLELSETLLVLWELTNDASLLEELRDLHRAAVQEPDAEGRVLGALALHRVQICLLGQQTEDAREQAEQAVALLPQGTRRHDQATLWLAQSLLASSAPGVRRGGLVVLGDLAVRRAAGLAGVEALRALAELLPTWTDDEPQTVRDWFEGVLLQRLDQPQPAGARAGAAFLLGNTRSSGLTHGSPYEEYAATADAFALAALCAVTSEARATAALEQASVLLGGVGSAVAPEPIRTLDEVMQLLENLPTVLDEGESEKWAMLWEDAQLRRVYLTGDLPTLQRLVRRLEERTSGGRSGTGLQLARLGLALRLLAQWTGDHSLLERAVDVHERALSPSGPHDRPSVAAVLLGAALRERYEVMGDRRDLDRSAAHLQRALDDPHLRAMDRVDALGNLGLSLLDRHTLSRDPEDLRRGVDALREAAAARRPDTEDGIRARGNLGAALLALAADGGATEAVAEAAAAFTEAADARPRGHPARLRDLLHLGIARAGEAGAESAEAARQAWRHVLAEAPAGGPVVLRAAELLGRSAFEQGDWTAASEADHVAARQLRTSAGGQLLRGHRSAVLAVARGLPGRSAYALARQGRLEEAVLALERTRGLLGNAALAREEVEVARREAAGADLGAVAAYRSAAARLQTLRDVELRTTAPLRADQLDAVRDALGSLDDARTALGLDPAVGEEVALDEVRAAARRAPVCYVISTPAGGLGLTVSRDGPVEATWLPGLNGAHVSTHLVAFMTAYRSRAGSRQGWADTLDATLGWLGESVGGWLADRFHDEDLTLIPVGTLAALPLHAAWSRGRWRSRRRYLVDVARPTYAPSALALAFVDPPLAAGTRPSALAVCEPRPSALAPLPHAAQEAHSVARVADPVELLLGADATPGRVLDGLGRGELVHLACHGRSSFDDPLRSALLLADDEPLALRDLLVQRLDRTRLVVLSACETAVQDLALPDETVSLTSGLLAAGARSVVGSLWGVPDESTSALVDELYAGLARGASISRSLVDAQRRVRDGDEGWSHPVFWAAFAAFGRCT